MLDVLRNTGGVIPDPRQERGVHLGEPWKAQEVDAGHRGNAMLMSWLSDRVQNWQVDPAEVEAVTRSPDHRTQSHIAGVELAQGGGDAGGIGKPGASSWLSRQIHFISLHVIVYHVQERIVGG